MDFIEWIGVIGSVASILGLIFFLLEKKEQNANNVPSKFLVLTITISIALISIIIYRNKTNGTKPPGGGDSSEKVIEEPGVIELLDLLKLFIIPGDKSHNAANWMIGTEEESPIIWETEGIEWRESNKSLPTYYGPGYRLGKIKIDIDGNPSHYILRKKKEQVIWSIYLEGARAGYFNVRLENGVCSQQFDLFVNYFKSKGLINEVNDCVLPGDIGFDSYSAGDGMLLYSFEINNRQVTFLEFYYCSGTCGCSNKLVFSADGMLPIKENEIVLKEYN